LNNKIPPNLTQSDTTLPNPLKINKYFFCEQIQVKQGRITNVTTCPIILGIASTSLKKVEFLAICSIHSI
jgi:hypothetical protein